MAEDSNMAAERNLRPTGTEGMAQPRIRPVGKEPTPLGGAGGQLPPKEEPKAPVPGFLNEPLKSSAEVAVSNPASMPQPPLVESPVQAVISRPNAAREVDHRVNDAVEAGLVHTPPAQPGTHSRRSFLALIGVGTGVAVGTAVEAKTGFLRGLLGIGKHRVIAPGVSSDGNPSVDNNPTATQVPTEVPPTQTPTEVPPVIVKGEKGLHESVDQMKGTLAQKERVKKIFEENQLEFINDTSAGGLMPDILNRVEMRPLGIVGGKPELAVPVKKLKINTADWGENAGQQIDKVGQAGIAQAALRDGGVAEYVAYNGDDSLEVRRFKVNPETFFVYLYRGQPPEPEDKNVKQVIFQQQSTVGNISTFYPEDNVMKVELLNADPVGSAARVNDKIAAASSIAAYHTAQSFPPVAKFNFDGHAAFQIVDANSAAFVNAGKPFLQIIAPEWDKGNRSSVLQATN